MSRLHSSFSLHLNQQLQPHCPSAASSQDPAVAWKKRSSKARHCTLNRGIVSTPPLQVASGSSSSSMSSAVTDRASLYNIESLSGRIEDQIVRRQVLVQSAALHNLDFIAGRSAVALPTSSTAAAAQRPCGTIVHPHAGCRSAQCVLSRRAVPRRLAR